jgi:hypothetical protein
MAGGLAGWVGTNITFSNATYPSWSGDVVNSGTIKFNGTTKSGVQLGGIVGRMLSNGPVITDGKLINFGDVICTGTYDKSIGAVNCAGGIYGHTTKGINNAVAYCNVDASEIASGMITGVERSASVVATNCEIGGTIKKWVEKTDAEQNVTTKLETITLADENFYNYIYSSPITTEQATGDVCSSISQKPTLPTVPVVPPTTEETPVE